MQLSDITLNPSVRTMRQFALGLLLLLGGLAAWQVFAKNNDLAALILAILAIVLGIGGLIRPRMLRFVFVAWLCLAFPIGWLVSQATLVILFYGVFTPLALIFRLCGRDVLARRRPGDYNSCWQTKPAPRDVRAYLRQS
jgi:hypothetical protein